MLDKKCKNGGMRSGPLEVLRRLKFDLIRWIQIVPFWGDSGYPVSSMWMSVRGGPIIIMVFRNLSLGVIFTLEETEN